LASDPTHNSHTNLTMASTLGLTFDLATGVPVVDNVRPVFTAPREGDVLTAINGAELSKCALTVSQLALLLKALPRPLKLSFMEGSPSLQVTHVSLLLHIQFWFKLW